MQFTNLIFYASPALFFLIFLESAFMMKEKRDNAKDFFSSLGLLVGRMPFTAITNVFILFTYTLIYNLRFFTLRGNCWWTWIICLFADDFSYYWYHRFSHQIRFLWASHQVHHSSVKFTFVSGFRVPWTSNLTGNFLFWAWMPLIGLQPYMIMMMKSVSVLYQFWMHTEKIRRLPKWFEAFFNTPSHHRVHHGSNLEYLDKNHGGTLIIWDKMFGTFQQEVVRPKYGLTKDVKSFNPFVIAFHEWAAIVRDCRKTKKLKDRFNYLFNSPGWSHDGTTKTRRQLQLELGTIKKKNLD